MNEGIDAWMDMIIVCIATTTHAFILGHAKYMIHGLSQRIFFFTYMAPPRFYTKFYFDINKVMILNYFSLISGWQ